MWRTPRVGAKCVESRGEMEGPIDIVALLLALKKNCRLGLLDQKTPLGNTETGAFKYRKNTDLVTPKLNSHR